jgi:hypothetical protein
MAPSSEAPAGVAAQTVLAALALRIAMTAEDTL